MALEGARDVGAREWSPALFGRDRDLDTVATCLTEGRHVAVVAPAGAGKTSFAIALLRRLAENGWMTAMLPSAQVTCVSDIAQLIAVQVAETKGVELAEVADLLRPPVARNSHELVLGGDQSLSVALELLVQAGLDRQGRSVLAIDDMDALYTGGQRTAKLGETLARKLRGLLQRSNRLTVLFLARSEAAAREAFGDASAPMFGDATVYRFPPLSFSDCRALISDRAEEAGHQVSEEALVRLLSASAGLPLYLRLAAGAAVDVARKHDTRMIDVEVAEVALTELRRQLAPVTSERVESIRRTHRLGLFVARRLARSESPYAGERSPNNITRVLKKLERIGVVSHLAPRDWTLTDPLLVDALRELEPSAIAASTSTLLSSKPALLPSVEWSLRRLRGQSAWHLRPYWFETDTVIRDAVQGDIPLTRLECAIMASPEFQRLRRLRQLGTAHLVYPGATHTRFEHSVGALASVTKMAEAALASIGDDEAQGAATQWPEVIVLARIAALVHDLALVPFADALESHAELPLGEYASRLEHLWEAIVSDLDRSGFSEDEMDALNGGRFCSSLLYACDNRFDDDEVNYRFVRGLVRGPMSADSVDSLVRDRRALGYGGEAPDIATALRLVPVGEGRDRDFRLGLAMDERPDYVEAQVISCLQLHRERAERIVGHPTTCAANAMLASAVSRWVFLHERGETGSARWDQPSWERDLLNQSDDGLLDHLRRFSAKQDERRISQEEADEASALAHLIENLLARRLYKCVASATWENHGDGPPDELAGRSYLRNLELEVARAAGIDKPGQILLFVLRPSRPSFGDLFLADEGGISRIRERGDHMAAVIQKLEEPHPSLTAVYLLADPSIPRDSYRLLVDWLGSRTGWRWHTASRDQD